MDVAVADERGRPGAAVAGASYSSVFDPGTLWIFSLLFTLAVLLFTEIVPKTMGVVHADKLALPVTGVVDVSLDAPPRADDMAVTYEALGSWLKQDPRRRELSIVRRIFDQ